MHDMDEKFNIYEMGDMDDMDERDETDVIGERD